MEDRRIDTERLIKALEVLVQRKRPRNPVYIDRLKSKIQKTSQIKASEILDALIRAGYGLKEIVWYLKTTRIIRTKDEWLGVKRAVIRYVAIKIREAREGKVSANA